VPHIHNGLDATPLADSCISSCMD